MALGAAIYFAWTIVFPSVTLRYRLTLHAEVEGRPSSGSGVIQVTYAKNPPFLGASAQISIAVRGEAVVLDLGPRGLLVASLKEGDHPRSGAEYIVPLAWGFPGGVGPVDFPRLRSLRGRVTLPFDGLPLLVRFRDINDATTVERVDPNNLAAAFGAGVALTAATIEIVDSGIWPLNLVGMTGVPITTTLESRLPSFGADTRFPEWRRTLPYGHPLAIDKTTFKRGLQCQ